MMGRDPPWRCQYKVGASQLSVLWSWWSLMICDLLLCFCVWGWSSVSAPSIPKLSKWNLKLETTPQELGALTSQGSKKNAAFPGQCIYPLRNDFCNWRFFWHGLFLPSTANCAENMLPKVFQTELTSWIAWKFWFLVFFNCFPTFFQLCFSRWF